MAITKNPFPIPLDRLGVCKEQFSHASEVHGPGHVNRVIFQALQIGKMHGYDAFLPEIWAAAYIHDLSRRSDGVDPQHGALAVLEQLPKYQDLFLRVGVQPERLPMIAEAVRIHATREENPENPVANVLKDADALDRVRIGDLDASQLRLEYSPLLIPQAEKLFELTADHPNWMAVWAAGQTVYSPQAGCAMHTPAPWFPQESGRERMLRRARQSTLAFPNYIGMLQSAPGLMAFAFQNILPDIQQGIPVVFMREEALNGVNQAHQFYSFWEMQELGHKVWHDTYSDNPADARAYNEARVFGECCRHTTYGVFLTPGSMPADPVLRKMYGEKRVQLKPDVLDAASFTVGDSQRSKFAIPYSPENVALVLSLYQACQADRRLLDFLPGNEPPRYIELQIHKQLTDQDILSVS
jgi:Predicted HD superfamily hydrolase